MNKIIYQSRVLANALLIGVYFSNKYREQARTSSITRVAKNLRKQGVPVEVAVRLLAVR